MILLVRTFFILCLTLAFVSSCVSKKQYNDLEADLLNTRNQLDRVEGEYRETNLRLQDTEKSRDQCLRDLTNLKSDYDELEDMHVEISQNVEELRLKLKKKDTTIRHQKMVITKLDETRHRIEKGLKDEIANQNIKIEEMEGKLKVTFVDKILFDTGSVTIKDKGKKILLEIAESLKGSEAQSILVEGHTDNIPMGPKLKDRFPSNWELSTARAAAVVRFFQESLALDPQRLSACGYGSFRPVASNDTADGRRQNRRIEIILVPSR